MIIALLSVPYAAAIFQPKYTALISLAWLGIWLAATLCRGKAAAWVLFFLLIEGNVIALYLVGVWIIDPYLGVHLHWSLGAQAPF